MTTLTAPAPTVNASRHNAPSAADRTWWAAQSSEYHATDPTPVEALREPWASWPDWTDADVWTLSDAEADAMAEESEAQARMESMGYL